MKIVSIDPYWYHLGEENNYLSARFYFHKNFVKGLYFSSKKNFSKWVTNSLKSGSNPLELIKGKEIIFSLSNLNARYDVAVLQSNPVLESLDGLTGIKIPKCVALFDYNYNTSELSKILIERKVHNVIGHSRHDKFDSYFKYFFRKNNFKKVLDYPFGYNDKRSLNRKNRSNKILGLGAISRIDRPDMPELFDYYNFMKDNNVYYSHIERKWFRDNHEVIREIFENYLPDDSVRRNISIREHEILPKYTFFLNDLGSLNFLPARFFEGIGNGVIPFAVCNPIYESYGFDSSNMVFYQSNNPKSIFSSYNLALENLESLQNELNTLAPKYSYDNINQSLFQQILNVED